MADGDQPNNELRDSRELGRWSHDDFRPARSWIERL